MRKSSNSSDSDSDSDADFNTKNVKVSNIKKIKDWLTQQHKNEVMAYQVKHLFNWLCRKIKENSQALDLNLLMDDISSSDSSSSSSDSDSSRSNIDLLRNKDIEKAKSWIFHHHHNDVTGLKARSLLDGLRNKLKELVDLRERSKKPAPSCSRPLSSDNSSSGALRQSTHPRAASASQSIQRKCPTRPSAEDSPPSVKASAEALDPNLDHCVVCVKPGDLICCEACPRAYHEDCLSQEEREDAEEEDWECHRCTKEDTKPSYQGMVSKARGNLAKCGKIMEILTKHDLAKPFLKPVDLKKYPDYLKKCPEPMDLMKIEKQLNSYKDDVDQFCSDLQSVWDNCKQYNDQNSWIYRSAEVLEKISSRIQKGFGESPRRRKQVAKADTFSESGGESTGAEYKVGDYLRMDMEGLWECNVIIETVKDNAVVIKYADDDSKEELALPTTLLKKAGRGRAKRNINMDEKAYAALSALFQKVHKDDLDRLEGYDYEEFWGSKWYSAHINTVSTGQMGKKEIIIQYEDGSSKKRTVEELVFSILRFRRKQFLTECAQSEAKVPDLVPKKADMGLISKRIKIHWEDDGLYYNAKVEKFNELTGKYKIKYDDGTSEFLDLESETYELLEEEIKVPSNSSWHEDETRTEVQDTAGDEDLENVEDVEDEFEAAVKAKLASGALATNGSWESFRAKSPSLNEVEIPVSQCKICHNTFDATLEAVRFEGHMRRCKKKRLMLTSPQSISKESRLAGQLDTTLTNHVQNSLGGDDILAAKQTLEDCMAVVYKKCPRRKFAIDIYDLLVDEQNRFWNRTNVMTETMKALFKHHPNCNKVEAWRVVHWSSFYELLQQLSTVSNSEEIFHAQLQALDVVLQIFSLKQNADIQEVVLNSDTNFQDCTDTAFGYVVKHTTSEKIVLKTIVSLGTKIFQRCHHSLADSNERRTWENQLHGKRLVGKLMAFCLSHLFGKWGRGGTDLFHRWCSESLRQEAFQEMLWWMPNSMLHGVSDKIKVRPNMQSSGPTMVLLNDLK
mmetsp:Transcript_40950/g.52744  ORF Transcript_40950/g.52744 Transcript_40950/m.52744 type:complete len:1017 (+) Transcript_40950:97-3147(+)